MPMAVFTFLEAFDFTGKKIAPFCTNEGSGMGVSERDLRRICKGGGHRKGPFDPRRADAAVRSGDRGLGKGMDVASNSAYVLPNFLINKKVYALAETDEEKFVAKLIKKSNLAKGDYQRLGFAYSLSKNFVVWYAKKCAFEYGKQGIRVVSLSPGLIATDMGNLEAKDGGMLIPFSAEERMGKPEELGYALATVADERNDYLAGVDVLVDGGSTNGMKEFKKKK